MTHLLLLVLVVLDCTGIGVVDAAAVVNVVGVELVLSDVVLLLECLLKTMYPLKTCVHHWGAHRFLTW